RGVPAVGQEQVPQALRACLALEPLDHGAGLPGTAGGARAGIFGGVGGLFGPDVLLQERLQALVQGLGARTRAEVHKFRNAKLSSSNSGCYADSPEGASARRGRVVMVQRITCGACSDQKCPLDWIPDYRIKFHD